MLEKCWLLQNINNFILPFLSLLHVCLIVCLCLFSPIPFTLFGVPLYYQGALDRSDRSLHEAEAGGQTDKYSYEKVLKEVRVDMFTETAASSTSA